MALTRRAHQLVREHLNNNRRELAVDATCGNGHDTEFLARSGVTKVLAFDVQKQAIEATRRRLESSLLNNVELIHSGHETLDHHTKGPIDCVMFNLGYLPHGDKTLTTNQHNSIHALEIATQLLSDSGIISIMCYPGHSEGAEETKAIGKWLDELSSKWRIQTELANSPKPSAPILYLLTRDSE